MESGCAHYGTLVPSIERVKVPAKPYLPLKKVNLCASMELPFSHSLMPPYPYEYKRRQSMCKKDTGALQVLDVVTVDAMPKICANSNVDCMAQNLVDAIPDKAGGLCGSLSISEGVTQEEIWGYIQPISRNERKMEIICQFGDYEVWSNSLQTLKPRGLLSGEVVNGVAAALFEEEKERSSGIQVWYLPSYFWDKVQKGTDAARYLCGSKRHSSSIGPVETCQQIIFPMNVPTIKGGDTCRHWCVVVVDMRRKTVSLLDSLLTAFETRKEEIKIALAALDQGLQAPEFSYPDGKPPLRTSHFEIVALNTQQQSNVHDCGVYVCNYMRHAANNISDMAQLSCNLNTRKELLTWLLVHQHNTCREEVLQRITLGQRGRRKVMRRCVNGINYKTVA